MITPEEIKAALAYCMHGTFCNGCPIETKCDAGIIDIALTYIEQLEEQIQLMKIQMHGDCGVCKHRINAQVTPAGPRFTGPCYQCMQKESRPNWEYEGLPELPEKGASK